MNNNESRPKLSFDLKLSSDSKIDVENYKVILRHRQKTEEFNVVPEIAIIQPGLKHNPIFNMTPYYLYHQPELLDYGKRYSFNDQDFELSVNALKVLVHPCFKSFNHETLEYLFDKLQKLNFQNRHRLNVDLLTLMRPYIQTQQENKCKQLIRVLPEIPVMRVLWERPPENSEDPFRSFRNRYTQTEVVQMTRRKTDCFTIYEFFDKFKELNGNNERFSILNNTEDQLMRIYFPESIEIQLAQMRIILDKTLFNSIMKKMRPQVDSFSKIRASNLNRLSAPIHQQNVIEIDDDSDIQELESTPLTSSASQTFSSPSKVLVSTCIQNQDQLSDLASLPFYEQLLRRKFKRPTPPATMAGKQGTTEQRNKKRKSNQVNLQSEFEQQAKKIRVSEIKNAVQPPQPLKKPARNRSSSTDEIPADSARQRQIGNKKKQPK